MDLSIIIVNYNTKELTRNCIDSIISTSVRIDYEIILVDNASKDGSCEYLKELFPNLQIISNSENLGFAKANNQGIKIAEGKYILLLNSDTIILGNCLEKVKEFMDSRDDVGVVGCKVLNRDKTLQDSCYQVPNFITELLFFTKDIIKNYWDPISYCKYMKFWNHDTIKEVGVISGCFMFIQKKVFDEVSFLDENFFMYYEDSEFCRRVHKKSSYKIIFYPAASIAHLRAMSSDNMNCNAVKQTYLSALFYIYICYGRIWRKIFRFLCMFFWGIEIMFFLPFSRHANFMNKIIMLKQLCKLGGDNVDENS